MGFFFHTPFPKVLCLGYYFLGFYRDCCFWSFLQKKIHERGKKTLLVPAYRERSEVLFFVFFFFFFFDDDDDDER